MARAIGTWPVWCARCRSLPDDCGVTSDRRPCTEPTEIGKKTPQLLCHFLVGFLLRGAPTRVRLKAQALQVIDESVEENGSVTAAGFVPQTLDEIP